ncbi:dimethylsulfonioproprionate lyase family protein [Roseovarius sp. CAU 1744]|uniref:dimethylsulfonioproprionate lyase family protein n=1 Tax=Roseovarius sp. CAU 1744 TaxID=3140368 RepID=UPI00325B4E05
MSLGPLFRALADAFDGPLEIELQARAALLSADTSAAGPAAAIDLPGPFLEVMARPEAHPVCRVIAGVPLPWAPPQTSPDPDYVAHSLPKRHVELLGPDGLVGSDTVRLGLYGILPRAEYGIRTHPAEEVFVMLAGEAYWKRGGDDYALLGPGQRAHHPSMMPHATRTRRSAFLSAYVWCGDVSTEHYVYAGRG